MNLEQEINKYICIHMKSTLLSALESCEEIYSIPEVASYEGMDIEEICDTIRETSPNYRIIYERAWELIEPYIKDNQVYLITEGE